MSDRSIRLDTATSGLADQTARQPSAGYRDSASQEEADRFRRALADSPEAQIPAAPRDPGDVPHARGAFGLFGRQRAAHAAAALTAGAAGAPPPVLPADHVDGVPRDRGEPANPWQVADEVAERILVSGDGGREACIVIRDDVLPGVEVRVSQEQGRWVVAFLVAEAASFELLERAGADIAQVLAGRLGSGVELRLAHRSTQQSPKETARCFFADPSVQKEAIS